MSDRRFGTRILGTGSAVPEGVLTNADLEKILDTSDEWIRQRTGIRKRHICDPERGEGNLKLCIRAMDRALEDSDLEGADLDLLIVATVTGEMTCPSTSCRVSDAIGCKQTGAFDVLAACSGFVYGLNVAESMIQSGRYKTIGVVGCDTLSDISDYTDRSVSILLGDAAGAVVMQRAEDDTEVGCMHQLLGADGSQR